MTQEPHLIDTSTEPRGRGAQSERRALPRAAAIAMAVAAGSAAATTGSGRPSALRQPGPTDEIEGSVDAAQAETLPVPAALTRVQAARFLSQAAFGGSAADIQRVQQLGVQGWLDAEFAKPQGESYQSLVQRLQQGEGSDCRQEVQTATWIKMKDFPDVLRQRVTLALSELFVMFAVVKMVQRGKAVATYMDVLEKHAFGNYRDLLLGVATSHAMGRYLSHVGNKKANAATGSSPDENFARELMQLFTIGTVRLNMDGTEVRGADGKPIENYRGVDVSGLARVMTGWVPARGPGYFLNPMVMVEADHESGPKTFLGKTIAAGTKGRESLEQAIDILMAHDSMAPFVAKQLIQRFATSNPSRLYVERVAKAFNGGNGIPKGDMKNVLRAIFTWPGNFGEGTLVAPRRGKLREPMVRFIQWARTFKVQFQTTGSGRVDSLNSSSEALGQSPLLAPSIFNFFRPGYVPSATSELGKLGLKAPEVQITDEVSVAGYMNFMQRAVANGFGNMQANYSSLMPLVPDPVALVNELNVILAAGQLSHATKQLIVKAVSNVNADTAAGAANRLHTALFFVFVAPEYVAQK